MSSKQTTLHYGQPDEVMDILDASTCDEGELRAALINAFRRIQSLEKQIVQISLNAQNRGIS